MQLVLDVESCQSWLGKVKQNKIEMHSPKKFYNRLRCQRGEGAGSLILLLITAIAIWFLVTTAYGCFKAEKDRREGILPEGSQTDPQGYRKPASRKVTIEL